MTALDPRVAQQLAADLPNEVFLEIVQTYRTDLGRLHQQMRQAVAARQPEEFRGAAHALAGAAGSIGALALERAARRAMQPSTPPDMPALLPEIDQEALAALAELGELAERLQRG